MIDLYLRASDEATMVKTLLTAGLLVETEENLLPAEGVSLDVIGTIIRVTGQNKKGEPITETLDGWHANVRCVGLTEEQEKAVEPIRIIPPKHPYRVWA